jgi:hypothetical protein
MAQLAMGSVKCWLHVVTLCEYRIAHYAMEFLLIKNR